MALDVVTVGVVCADVLARPVNAWPGRGQLQVVPEMAMHLGGLASVTATILCKLGGRAACIARVGNDGFGDFIVETMRSHGVNVHGVLRDPLHATSSTVVLINSDGERTFLHHIGATCAVGEADIDWGLVEQARVLHWGGPSITPALDGAPIARVMEKAQAMGITTSMDTIFDGNGVWYPHIEAVLPHLNVVMSSLEEARHYTGCDTAEEIADFYLSKGPELVVIKLGNDGMYAKSVRESHHLPAHDVEVVDTTGAGDAACGAFLYGYTRDWDLLASMRLANAVGALTVQKMGGAEGVTTLEDTIAFMESRPVYVENH